MLPTPSRRPFLGEVAHSRRRFMFLNCLAKLVQPLPENHILGHGHQQNSTCFPFPTAPAPNAPRSTNERNTVKHAMLRAPSDAWEERGEVPHGLVHTILPQLLPRLRIDTSSDVFGRPRGVGGRVGWSRWTGIVRSHEALIW